VGVDRRSKLCGYAAVAERSSRLVQLSVVTDAGMTKELKDRKYTAKQLFTDSRAGATSVAGLGEDAYMGGPNALNVLQKDVSFTVSVTGGATGQGGAPVTVESLTALARTVLERLPR